MLQHSKVHSNVEHSFMHYFSLLIVYKKVSGDDQNFKIGKIKIWRVFFKYISHKMKKLQIFNNDSVV